MKGKGNRRNKRHRTSVECVSENGLEHTPSPPDERQLTKKRPRESDEETSDSGDHQSIKKAHKGTVHQKIPNRNSSILQQPKMCQRHEQSAGDFSCSSKVILPTSDVLESQRNLSSLEAAFATEKISKAIFSCLGPSDLLQCRLVSSSWRRLTTVNNLLKWKQLHIVYTNHQEMDESGIVEVNGQIIRLKDLTDFMNSLDAQNNPSSCSLNLELNMTITPNCFLEFIECWGFAVNTLSITFQEKEKGQVLVYQMDSLSAFVTKLLTEQTPNLGTLRVKFEKDVKFADCIDKHTRLVFSRRNCSHCARKQNQSLHTVEFGARRFSLYGRTPIKIIKVVCCLAPKLKRLDVEDMRLRVENKHRLPVLTEIFYGFGRISIIMNDRMKSVKKLYVKVFIVIVTFTPGSSSWLESFLNQFSHSLEELRLIRVYSCPKILFPRMPKVKLLSINSCDFSNQEWSMLPQGISLATTFPILRTIEFDGDGYLEVFCSNFLWLCRREVVASVRRIVNAPSCIDEKDFQKRFPCAVVTYESKETNRWEKALLQWFPNNRTA